MQHLIKFLLGKSRCRMENMKKRVQLLLQVTERDVKLGKVTTPILLTYIGPKDNDIYFTFIFGICKFGT